MHSLKNIDFAIAEARNNLARLLEIRDSTEKINRMFPKVNKFRDRDHLFDALVALTCKSAKMSVTCFNKNIKNQERVYTRPRQIIAYIGFTEFKMGQSWLAKRLGGKHHTTIRAAIEKHDADFKTSKIYRELYDTVIASAKSITIED